MPNADTAAVRASSFVLTSNRQLSLRAALPLALTMKAVLVLTYPVVTRVAVPCTNAIEKKIHVVCGFQISFVLTFRAKFSVVFLKWYHVLFGLKAVRHNEGHRHTCRDVAVQHA